MFASRVTRDWWAQDANIFQSKVSPLSLLTSVGYVYLLTSLFNSGNWRKFEVDCVLYMATRCTVAGFRSVSTRDADRCCWFCYKLLVSQKQVKSNRSFDGIPDPKPSLPVWSFSSQMKTSRHRLTWAFQPPTPVSIAQQPIKQFTRSMASNPLQIIINNNSSSNNSQPARWWLSTQKRAKCVQPPRGLFLF